MRYKPQNVTPDQYKRLREKLGTQEEVAAKLGIARTTIARREVGIVPLTREAELALRALVKPKPRPGV